MTEPKFTPDPWVVDDGDCGLWGIFEDADGSEIAYLVTLDGLNQPLKPEQAQANARLMAAAPDLYEALEEVSRRLAMIAPNRAGDAQSKEAGIKLAERSLAKARGGQ